MKQCVIETVGKGLGGREAGYVTLVSVVSFLLDGKTEVKWTVILEVGKPICSWKAVSRYSGSLQTCPLDDSYAYFLSPLHHRTKPPLPIKTSRAPLAEQSRAPTPPMWLWSLLPRGRGLGPGYFFIRMHKTIQDRWACGNSVWAVTGSWKSRWMHPTRKVFL